MKIFLVAPLLLLLSSSIKAEANNSNHEKCLQAADYEGCMDFQSTPSKSNFNKKIVDCTKQVCLPEEVNQSTDNLGMKIIKGWYFYEDPVSRTARYYDPDLYRVNSGGETGRFFHQRMVLRIYTEGSSGRSGYLSSSGSGSANCTQGLYGSINCITTSPSITYIPGTPSTTPGVKQRVLDVIYDCEDKTVAEYWNNKIKKFEGLDGKKRKWHSWDNVKRFQRFSFLGHERRIGLLTKYVCQDINFKKVKIKDSVLTQFIKKGIKKRSSSNKKNVGNINCNSPVWKNKPRCN